MTLIFPCLIADIPATSLFDDVDLWVHFNGNITFFAILNELHPVVELISAVERLLFMQVYCSIAKLLLFRVAEYSCLD